MQAAQSQNPNPNPPIFTPNPNHLLFDFSNSQQQEQRLVGSEKMNSINVGSGGSGVSDCQFASPSVSGIGGARPGRSVPRLMKVRKHGPSWSQRGKSGAPTSGSFDFNTFRSGLEECSNRLEDAGGMQDLRDRYQSWKPFSSLDSGEKTDSTSDFGCSGSASFEFGESRNSGGFVFGVNSGISRSNSRGSVGVGASLPQEMERLNIGKGGGDQSGRRVEERVDSSLNCAGETGGLSGKSLSFDGASASSMSKLGDGLSKLNIEVPQTQSDNNVNDVANVERVFTFGGSGNVVSSGDGNAESKLHQDCGKSDGINKSEDSGSKVDHEGGFTSFVVGSKNKNNINYSGISFAANKLCDETKNLNLNESGNDDRAETAENTNYKVNEKSSSYFGNDEANVGYSFGSNANKVTGNVNETHIGSKVVDSGSGYTEEVEETQDANFKINEMSRFDFGSEKYCAGNFVDDYVNELPGKIKKVHIGSKIGDSSSCDAEAPCSSSSFRISSESREPGISTDNIFSTSPTRVTFQAASFGVAAAQSTENWRPVGASASSYSSSSGGTTFHSVGEDFECSSMEDAGQKSCGSTFHSVGEDNESSSLGGGEQKADSFSAHRVDQFFTFHTSLSTPKQDPSSSFRGILYTGLNHKPGFSSKKGQSNRTKSKTRKAKSRQPPPGYLWTAQNYGSKEVNHQEYQESPRHYSPMDFSPCEETSAADQSSRETSVTSEDFNLAGDNFLKDACPSVPADGLDEDLINVTHNVDKDEEDLKSGKLDEKHFRDPYEKHSEFRSSFEESFPVAESEKMIFNGENIGYGNNAGVAAAETLFSFHQNTEGQESDRKTQFISTSISGDFNGAKFTFAASSSSQEQFSAAKRQFRKKNRMKVGCDLANPSNFKQQFDSSSMQFFPFASSSLPFSNELNQKGDPSSCVGERNPETVKDSEVKQQPIPRDSEIQPVQEACEKWRLRGNQAYADGDLSKAEECYTKGVNCVFRNEISKSCSRALMLCYSNRALVRMAAGRMREALGDCKKAIKIDHEFLKAQVRAANCHLALGEVGDAIDYFKKILPSGDVVCLDRKTIIEASTGLHKAQQMVNYLDSCTELLHRKTCQDAESALKIIDDALTISPYSEKLLQIKAETLLVLRKHSELIQLCDQSLEFAEKNSASSSGDGQREKLNGSENTKISSAKLWRWFMISKSHFYQGKLEEALEFLDKLEHTVSAVPEYGNIGNNILESSVALAVTIRELLRHKIAGNEAFQSGRHSEAIEHYSSAISCNVESRPFAAICFCNRAAAYQALGQITEAIADCSLAIALDGNYPKAISRRATLHGMIRDYGQAVNDLRKFIFLLEKQMEEKANPSATINKSTGFVTDLRQARARLSTLEEEARKGIPLNMYQILGIEPSATASDIKKAYRKAALRHHPDKAGQFLARSENGDDGLWKDIAEEVHIDADRLFKMIGEAYAVLSDPIKRSRYDLEEESRNASKKGNGYCSQSTPPESPGYRSDRSSSSSRHYWHDSRRAYRSQYQWSDEYRSNRYW